MKKIIIFVFLLSASVIPLSTNASSAAITEIMYDLPGTDTGREWIEVQNTSTSNIDLSTWKLFEANTNHKITAIGAAVIAPGGFAILSDVPDKFKSDNTSFSGLIFDSTFSLSNEGETITIRDDSGSDVDTVSFLPTWGANGDGNSLQKNSSGSWISAPPTPGLQTTATQSTVSQSADMQSAVTSLDNSQSSESSDQDSGTSAYGSQETANTSSDNPELEISSGRSRLGFVGSSLSFEVKVKSIKNPPSGKSISSIWSMGDGTELSGSNIVHTYQYPGNYVVIVNSDFGNAHAVSKVKVSIVDPHVLISDLLPEYTELSNPDSFEVNIGGYTLMNEKGRFTIPQDTIILAHSSIKLPYQNTKLSFGTLTRLFDPSGIERSRSVMSKPSSDITISLPVGFTIDNFISAFKK